MKMTIKEDVIYAEDRPIAILLENITDDERTALIAGAEAYDSIAEFVSEINSGSFKLRAATRKFEDILRAY